MIIGVANSKEIGKRAAGVLRPSIHGVFYPQARTQECLKDPLPSPKASKTISSSENAEGMIATRPGQTPSALLYALSTHFLMIKV